LHFNRDPVVQLQQTDNKADHARYDHHRCAEGVAAKLDFEISLISTLVVSWSGHAGQFGDLGRKDGPSNQAQQLGQPEALTPAIQVRQLSLLGELQEECLPVWEAVGP